jgi:hypothetical protein
MLFYLLFWKLLSLLRWERKECRALHKPLLVGFATASVEQCEVGELQEALLVRLQSERQSIRHNAVDVTAELLMLF